MNGLKVGLLGTLGDPNSSYIQQDDHVWFQTRAKTDRTEFCSAKQAKTYRRLCHSVCEIPIAAFAKWIVNPCLSIVKVEHYGLADTQQKKKTILSVLAPKRAIRSIFRVQKKAFVKNWHPEAQAKDWGFIILKHVNPLGLSWTGCLPMNAP